MKYLLLVVIVLAFCGIIAFGPVKAMRERARRGARQKAALDEAEPASPPVAGSGDATPPKSGS